MDVGIVGDTHGFLNAWRTAYEAYLSKTDLILHVGDILYCSPGFNPLTDEFKPGELADAINTSDIPIIFCRGDNDSEVDQKKLKYPILSDFVYLYLDGLHIIMHHGEKPGKDWLFKSRLTPDEMEQYARKMKADIFIMGRTHIPVVQDRGGIYYLNPGSPVPTVHDNNRPSIAVLRTGSLLVEVWSMINIGELLFSRQISLDKQRRRLMVNRGCVHPSHPR